ncbi:tetratricopeptide repeat protein [Hippea jasoniae]|uniref:tetratricopeptide repeat protein n=1 Tax=Hippea jasoniae TaxID=944479 RepID=UPI0005592D71|nr:tetratricopeptide repeat protein [Hippea jasoniae]
MFEYRIGKGKQLDCKAYLKNQPDEKLKSTIENPLTNILNPNKILLQIEELEENLRNHIVNGTDDSQMYVRIARLYEELNQYERALNYLKTALSKANRPDPDITNLMGIYYKHLGNLERAEHIFKETLKVNRSPHVAFNLALVLSDQKKYREAVDVLDEFSSMSIQGPVSTLKALCYHHLKDDEEKKEAISQAYEYFRATNYLSDWEKTWYKILLKLTGDTHTLKKLEQSDEKSQSAEDEFYGIPKPVIMQ